MLAESGRELSLSQCNHCETQPWLVHLKAKTLSHKIHAFRRALPYLAC
jgi:hypothetical protein